LADLWLLINDDSYYDSFMIHNYDVIVEQKVTPNTSTYIICFKSLFNISKNILIFVLFFNTAFPCKKINVSHYSTGHYGGSVITVFTSAWFSWIINYVLFFIVQTDRSAGASVHNFFLTPIIPYNWFIKFWWKKKLISEKISLLMIMSLLVNFGWIKLLYQRLKWFDPIWSVLIRSRIVFFKMFPLFPAKGHVTGLIDWCIYLDRTSVKIEL